jgi:DNA-binding response OmpR family regulator
MGGFVMRILIAEDEKDLNDIIYTKLTKEGYSVDSVYDGREAMDYYDAIPYDIVVLDIMMPRADGFEVLKHIRDRGDNTPIIFLTARDSVDDRIKGLDSGANDYIIKPFALDELVARIRVCTRNSYGSNSNILKVSDLTLDTGKGTAKRGDRVIELSAKEYQLLEYLMYNKGILLSRERIESHVWNYDYEGGTNVVDVYISYLRKKIDDGFDKKLIKTMRGRGYMIDAD